MMKGILKSAVTSAAVAAVLASPLAQATNRIGIAPMALNAYEMHPFRIAMSLMTLNEFADGKSLHQN